VNAGPSHSLKLWILFEGDLRKQQLPKLDSGSVEDLDAMRAPLPPGYRDAQGFHIAPALPLAQAAAMRAIREAAPQATITLDNWTESFFDSDLYKAPGFLSQVDAFLPSDKEIENLWGLDDLVGTMRRLAAEGPRAVAIKRGEHGSLVYDRQRDTLWHVPAIPVRAVDVTGAGDAYCGGFLAGMVSTGDPLEAGMWGTVSASFAVQEYGARAGMRVDGAEAQRRLAELRSGVRKQ
jgi:ribokinase